MLRYLRYTREYGLHYTTYPGVLEGYSDSKWINGVKGSKSTSGYIFTLAGGAISWKSAKQTVVTKSTIEAEFVSLDTSGEHSEWLRQFVEDIPIWEMPVPPLCIHCDSTATIGTTERILYNGMSRHIHLRHNSVRQLLSTGVITIDFIRSKDNTTDPLNKGLTRELVDKLSKGMGLKPIIKVGTKETQPC